MHSVRMPSSQRDKNFPGVKGDASESPGPGHFTSVDDSWIGGVPFDKKKRFQDISETPGPGMYDA